jgi:murein peptide amidase A
VALLAVCGVIALAGCDGAGGGASDREVTGGRQAGSILSLGEHTVIATRLYGYSLKGHPLEAFELGRRSAPLTVVALAAMHGNEPAGSVVLRALRDGTPITGVNLWVIPRDNPDGLLRDSRYNARGVDLNRNFPASWRRQHDHSSGTRPSSEPETRALERFLNRVDPDYVVTIHAPFHGVDTYRSKDRAFARRLSRALGLPLKSFDCDGGCHGTLTQWFNNRHDGACVTVELGAHPRHHYLHVRAPRGLLRAIGGHR